MVINTNKFTDKFYFNRINHRHKNLILIFIFRKKFDKIPEVSSMLPLRIRRRVGLGLAQEKGGNISRILLILFLLAIIITKCR
jgi:hypothetical protein